MPQRPPVNGHGRGFLAAESENQKEEQNRPQNGHVSASLWCKMSPGCSQLALSPLCCCSPCTQDLPPCIPPHGPRSVVSNALPAWRDLGRRGSCTQREVATMDEGSSHFSFPSWTSSVPAPCLSPCPEAGRDRPPSTDQLCAFFCPCSLFWAHVCLRAFL